MFKLSSDGSAAHSVRSVVEKPNIGVHIGDGQGLSKELLFQHLVECPQCRASEWCEAESSMRCLRCGYISEISGRHFSLLPETLSANNAEEATAFDAVDEAAEKHLFDYTMAKPYNYPAVMRDAYLRCANLMRWAATDLGGNPSILFTFGGGGMEPHLSGLLGPNVVISDISRSLLNLAEQRYDYHKVSQPAAFITCDSERLPFKSGSFDLVVAFEGIHHCMVPQAALNEVWRVSRRRTLVVDNFECGLTSALFRLGKSSRIETSGVKPSRFTKTMIETMLYNAQLDYYWFKHRAAVPYGAAVRLGYLGTRLLERTMEFVGQTNMFILATDTQGPIDFSQHNKV